MKKLVFVLSITFIVASAQNDEFEAKLFERNNIYNEFQNAIYSDSIDYINKLALAQNLFTIDNQIIDLIIPSLKQKNDSLLKHTQELNIKIEQLQKERELIVYAGAGAVALIIIFLIIVISLSISKGKARKQLKQIINEKKALLEQIQDLKVNYDRQNEDLSIVSKKLTIAENSVKSSETINQTLKKENDELKQQLENLNNQLAEKIKELTDMPILKSQLIAKETQIKNLENANSSLKNQIDEFNNQLEDQRVNYEQLVNELQNKIEKFSSEEISNLSYYEEKISTQQQQIEAYSKEIEKLNQQIYEGKSDHIKLKEIESLLEKQRNEFLLQLKDKEYIIENLRNEIYQLKEQIKKYEHDFKRIDDPQKGHTATIITENQKLRKLLNEQMEIINEYQKALDEEYNRRVELEKMLKK